MVFIQEIAAHYNAFLTGRPSLPELSIQYTDLSIGSSDGSKENY
ncbi:MAG: hypothetical protein V7K89_14990 [Nostoc sp.]